MYKGCRIKEKNLPDYIPLSRDDYIPLHRRLYPVIKGFNLAATLCLILDAEKQQHNKMIFRS